MATMTLTRLDRRSSRPEPVEPLSTTKRLLWLAWAGFVLVAIVALDLLPLAWWAGVVALGGALLALASAFDRSVRWLGAKLDARDLAVVALLYAGVVAAFRIAFVAFTPARTLGMFLFFAGGMLLGVGGPVVYTVWVRRRPLRDLGVGLHNLRPTLVLAFILGGAQFAVTLWGYDLPAPVDWVPLLVMSLTVGLFEAVFFRGFVQGRLEESFGVVPAVVGAATLYALYHLGYGMGPGELWFLFGLGVVYAIAYRLADNFLVLWPLLTPLGAFFNNVEAADIVLPWASIAGFADVLALMAVVLWLARRRSRAVADRTDGPDARGLPTHAGLVRRG